AAGQRLAHEDFVRRRRILLAELHHTPLDQNQAEQADLFIGNNRAALARPMRVMPTAPDQVRGLLLDPERLDARALHRIDLADIDDLPGQQPLRRRLGQRRTREDRELALARATVLVALILARNLG